MNSLKKLVAFIVVVIFCVFVSKTLTPPTPQDLVSSISYINNTLQSIRTERDNLSERIKLGLEDNDKLILLDYKYNKINSFLDGGYKLSTPCSNYCNYLKSKEVSIAYGESFFGENEKTKACYSEYFLYANNLFDQAQTATLAYLNKESISKEEYKNIIADIKIKNNDIINEVKRVLELTAIPEVIICSDEVHENIKL